MNKLITFLKNWTLPISMIIGALSYFIYANIPFLAPTKPFVNECISYIQPLLIFCMLFLTFCKIQLRDLKPKRWFVWLALMQCGLFSIMSMFLYFCPDSTWRAIIEGTMLMFMCPTATAAAVVTQKLGASAAVITAYTIIINLIIAVLAPVMLPLAHPHQGLEFLPAFITIIRKVFPLLICPLIVACLVRRYLPRFHQMCVGCKDLAFYLWAIALAIAIAVTCKAIVHSQGALSDIIGIAVGSLLACLLQFGIGKLIGGAHGHRIEGGQALGQKNTVFIIWVGYTFLTPISAIAGGFYSVWHNLINTYQLYKYRKGKEGF
ncbi:MAG: transporter [Bacteroidaceae bacterium]|nr:transporter [Bacteroidaceae bacterium]